ncbi:hypothetical protein BH10BAC5_BH10BAC5_05630 [soil metagenome]
MQNRISINEKGLIVPDHPVIPFIEGDGIGRDIWKASKQVFDSAVEKAYGTKRKIDWLETFAGEKSFVKSGSYLPDETVQTLRDNLISIKGPLTTPVGGGIRSINVTLRQVLDLYVCLRPVKYYQGIVTPMKHPEKVNMVIFRENTEDIYTGIEFKAGTPENKKVLDFFRDEFPDQFNKIRFGTLEKTNEFLKISGREQTTEIDVGVGIKVISKVGTERLMIAAIKYALANKRKSITLVHKGNIMKFTSGSFRDWAYDIAEKNFPDNVYTWREYESTLKKKGKDAAMEERRYKLKTGKILVKDAIADNALQQLLMAPWDYDLIATENLNGDYISDALAAQVGGIGIAPGSNINFITGHAIFEATHGTAPTFADLDMANPCSLLLSGVMMLNYIGWNEAADLIEKGIEKAILSKKVTFDFAREMPGSTELKTSEFANEIIKNFN